MRTLRIFGVLAAALLCISGCGGSNRGRDGSADVILKLRIQQGESVAFIHNVRAQADTLMQLEIESIAKAPGTGGISGVPDLYNDVRLDSYTVSYTAYDGGRVQGKDVPASFLVNVGGLLIDLGDVGVINDSPIVWASADTQPPLNGDASADPLPINTSAEVCVFGHQLNGDSVSDCMTMSVFFIDAPVGP